MTASASNLWSECNDRTADDRQIGFRSHPSGMRPETNGFSHDLCMKQSTGLFHSLALLRPVFRIPSLIKNPVTANVVTGFLVGVAGFEPAASWTRTKRDTKLRHTPIA